MLRPAAILAAVVLVLVPSEAVQAAGCEVLRDARDRTDCIAREHAREAARAEVERRAGDASIGSAGGGRSANGDTAAWQDALEDSRDIDLGDLVDTRLLAAIGGLAWFHLALRRQRRLRRSRA